MQEEDKMLYDRIFADGKIRKIKVVTDIILYIDIHYKDKISVQIMPADNVLYHRKYVPEKQFWKLMDYAIEKTKFCGNLTLNCEYGWNVLLTKELVCIIDQYNKNEIAAEEVERLFTQWAKKVLQVEREGTNAKK